MNAQAFVGARKRDSVAAQEIQHSILRLTRSLKCIGRSVGRRHH